MQQKDNENQDMRHSNLVEHIESEMPKMSKGQKAIARFILSDYERAAYMTAAKIGEEAGVSESTVVRFTMELGYEGYPHFQHLLQEELKVKLTSVQRLNASRRFSSDGQVLSSILQTDIENLKSTYENIDSTAFSKAVETILASKRIFVMGLRSSAPLSSFIHFYVRTIIFQTG